MYQRELPDTRRRGADADRARVRPKLIVGRVDDPQELEADWIAAAVMRSIGRGVEPAQVPPADATRVRRAAGTSGDRLGGTAVAPEVGSRINARRGAGRPLDPSTSSTLGQAFGTDLSGVRVHTDGEADTLNRTLDAKAFTVGNDIFFRGDQRGSADRPNELLAHELTHVVQQGGGASIGRQVVRRAKAPTDMVAAANAKAVADKAQTDARAQLLAWVREGAKSTDRRLRNSCEMILQGKIRLYALTLTGDTAERVTAKGKKPAKIGAWFPAGVRGSAGDLMSAAVSYNHADLADNVNIEFDDADSVGWNIGGSVAVCDVPSRTKDYVYETLRHELQHATDHSDDKESAAKAAGDKGKAKLECYKTEYRAYSYEGSDNDSYSPTKKVQAEGFTWTERQRHIFQHIYAGYDHTQKGWDTNPMVDGKPFRQHVIEYVDPDSEGFNKYNSPRVEELYQAVKACADGERNIKAATVKTVMDKIALLKREDAIACSKENPDWNKLINAKFGMIVRNQILNKIQQMGQ